MENPIISKVAIQGEDMQVRIELHVLAKRMKHGDDSGFFSFP